MSNITNSRDNSISGAVKDDPMAIEALVAQLESLPHTMAFYMSRYFSLDLSLPAPYPLLVI